jgi:bacillithiol system protein YtxJ
MTDKWKTLTSEKQIEEINEISFQRPVVIFKHSTRCSISAVSWSRFNSAFAKSTADSADFYYLDILSNRGISNALAERYRVHHESPQVLLISKGECIADASHFNISYSAVENAVEAL